MSGSACRQIPLSALYSALGARQAELRSLGARATATLHPTFAGSPQQTLADGEPSCILGRRPPTRASGKVISHPYITPRHARRSHYRHSLTRLCALPTRHNSLSGLTRAAYRRGALCWNAEDHTTIDGSTSPNVGTRPVDLARYTSDRHISDSPPVYTARYGTPHWRIYTPDTDVVYFAPQLASLIPAVIWLCFYHLPYPHCDIDLCRSSMRLAHIPAGPEAIPAIKKDQ